MFGNVSYDLFGLICTWNTNTAELDLDKEGNGNDKLKYISYVKKKIKKQN